MESSAGHLLSRRNKGKAPSGSGQALENTFSNRSICKNISCRSVLRKDSVFCLVCSCHLCGLYDEQKDPSLWISCQPDGPQDDCCEMSCHIECALKAGHLGVSSGPFTPFDASYWCTSCGKISDILGCWTTQLTIAKDAKLLGDLCYRVSLSYRLMENTSRYAELFNAVKGVKSNLEGDAGPLTRMSKRLKQSRLSKRPVSGLVQHVCATAIKMASMTNWAPDPRGRDGGVRPACRILIEEVSTSSIVLKLNDCPTTLMDGVIRFDVWCWRYRLEPFPEAPTASLEPFKTKVSFYHLQPSAEYALRIVSVKETGIFGVTEAKCFTKHASIIHKSPNPPGMFGSGNENPCPQRNRRVLRLSSEGTREANGSSCGMEVPIISVHPDPTGRTEALPSAAIKQVCGLSGTTTEANGSLSRLDAEGFPNAGIEQDCGPSERATEFQALDCPDSSPVTHLMDLNADPLPDLNEDLTPPSKPSQAEDDIRLEPVVGHEGNDASRGIQENAPEINPAVQAPSPNEGHGALGTRTRQLYNETFEGSVSTIRGLEREGHITQEFRMKFLSWFSFKAKEHDLQVFYTYLKSLSGDHKSLAEQLVDSFSHKIFK